MSLYSYVIRLIQTKEAMKESTWKVLMMLDKAALTTR